jgi:trk system potassium uptake protein TrkH
MTELLFEAQSALGTVGLSMGVTPHVTPSGRVLLVLLMFLGRVGPLAVLGAMARRASRGANWRYAHEDALVG